MNILHSNAAMHLRCDGIFSDYFRVQFSKTGQIEVKDL